MCWLMPLVDAIKAEKWGAKLHQTLLKKFYNEFNRFQRRK